MMTPFEAADAFNAVHPEDDVRVDPCPDPDHDWSDWGFAHVGTHEIRFCAQCGLMEQQWNE